MIPDGWGPPEGGFISTALDPLWISVNDFRSAGWDAWLESARPAVTARLFQKNDGNRPRWIRALEDLPDAVPSESYLKKPRVGAGTPDDLTPDESARLEAALRGLCPWRKGPFELFGILVDTEWRSDLKWDRFAGEIKPLAGRTVLDIGCGSGYHCWRMLGAGASRVIGIDPTLLYPLQFLALQKYLREPAAMVLPVGIDDLPIQRPAFDTVFSMGLIYHRRSPLDHLLQLQSCLNTGGEVVVETLVIDGEDGRILNPSGRYAKMPNVWFIPSVPTMETWMRRTGFKNVRCVDVTPTTAAEQRRTTWMSYHSLDNFLDPRNPGHTVEGYPAPRRAVFIGEI